MKLFLVVLSLVAIAAAAPQYNGGRQGVYRFPILPVTCVPTVT